MVMASFFPHLSSLSGTTAPTLAAATREVNWTAGELSGRLQTKNIDATGITDATSAAYYWCQQTLCLMTAIALLRMVTGADPDVAKAWMHLRDDRLDALEKQGIAALGYGAVASGTSEALGPTDWISELGVDVGDASEASGAIPVLRRDDMT